MVDANGHFEGTIELPSGQGWEGKTDVLVIAYTADFSVTAAANFQITTQLVPDHRARPAERPGRRPSLPSTDTTGRTAPRFS